jgi:hypothetical protein
MPRFTWSDTFPDNPAAEDKTASIEGYPRAFVRVYRAIGTRPDGKEWFWTVADAAQIASDWETDGRTAAEKAIAAWDAYLVRRRRNVE